MNKKILAVDDNLAILDVLEELLSWEGYEVIKLADGHHIFEMIEIIHPDLILLDVMLDTLDGRDICMEIKNNKSIQHIPVIMISATHDLTTFLNNPGAPDDFVEKPFDLDHLLMKINHQLAA
ncbi:Two-component response regulator SA14-24 [Arcticibacter svalbardensis MN12-7]|uniref:Two-component response regulator SA14-24 n=2 Tax=Arcticibacter TaxID=1288026 RepID=R9GX35_9SPHI|nr:Two-component response regulator SA14-24 [Arcticibacter svalbardensis MN12-7]